MEVLRSFETSVTIYQTTRCHIAEDRNLDLYIELTCTNKIGYILRASIRRKKAENHCEGSAHVSLLHKRSNISGFLIKIRGSCLPILGS
jgi:hypothetical protein